MFYAFRIFIFLLGFFFGGAFTGLVPHWSSWSRLMGIVMVLRFSQFYVLRTPRILGPVVVLRMPRIAMFGRVGFFFGIFVEAFKVGS